MSTNLSSIRDFPDRLSPMLVKELRQGLRTRSFIGVFLALQIVLGLILLFAGAGATSDRAGTVISGFIFVFFSLAVLLIQPMRGIAAVSSEIKGNTIDMMVLTRLSSWRIVIGKWFAIVAQSALLLITIIPYLILRYFFGGMNLFAEIVILILIFFTSATLTAITVGLSATGSVLLRSVLPIFAVPLGAGFLMNVIFGRRFLGAGFLDIFTLDSSESQITLAIYVSVCLYLGFFLLSIGASLIAPYAENHSSLRRIVALIVTIIATILSIKYVTEEEMLALGYMVIFTPIFACSLTEFTYFASPNYQKFNRLGFFGKVLGPFLLPGWPTGLFFCIVLIIISAFSISYSKISCSTEDFIVFTCLLCSLIFPALIINVFKIQRTQRIASYILFAVAASILTLVLGGIAKSMLKADFLWLFSWLPMMPLFMADETRIDDDKALVVSIIFNMIYIFIFLFLAIRKYAENVREVKQSIASSQ